MQLRVHAWRLLLPRLLLNRGKDQVGRAVHDHLAFWGPSNGTVSFIFLFPIAMCCREGKLDLLLKSGAATTTQPENISREREAQAQSSLGGLFVECDIRRIVQNQTWVTVTVKLLVDIVPIEASRLLLNSKQRIHELS